jgi:glutamine amidotransferase
MVAETRPAVDVIDLQTGNIGSVLKILERIGAAPRCVRSPEDLSGTAPTVLPGVGNFGHAAAELARSGMRSALDDVRARGVPILGICLGAQLMCLHSEEAPGQGLGWFPAAVRRFPKVSEEGIPVRVPNMGWMAVQAAPGSLPWDQPPGRMYFAHSYFIDPLDSGATAVAVSSYSGTRFAALLREGTVMGAQFHPEKSHRYGMAFLGAWLSWAREACG